MKRRANSRKVRKITRGQITKKAITKKVIVVEAQISWMGGDMNN